LNSFLISIYRDKIKEATEGDNDLLERKTRCFNKLITEQGAVDDFFKTFTNVVKTYGVFYHFAEMRDNVGLENNEFLSLSIFTVMELIQGGTLHDLCYRVAAFNRTLPVPQPPISLDERVILKIASQIVAVLKFLTDQVVHRDIKPLNIMLCNSLSDPQLLLLCRPSTDDAAFFKLLNEISIKVIDFGHPDPNGDGCNVTGASPIP